jgi:undecaprenyl-phosphate 4-deoxy-4-formamido-L-arabinose transferase
MRPPATVNPARETPSVSLPLTLSDGVFTLNLSEASMTEAQPPSSPPAALSPSGGIHRVSIVVPVYQGEKTLDALVEEILPLTAGTATPDGRRFQVVELILVHDGAIDNSHVEMQRLAAKHAFISLIWLSRNYGQHPATIAGMASSSAEWVVTLDEDGLQNPADTGRMLDQALRDGVPLVYARAVNAPPHGWIRNSLSALAKGIASWLVANRRFGQFNSFRLMKGEVARSLAAYCGSGVYLDVALSWVVHDCTSCPVQLRVERGRPSGYSLGKLIGHFWRLFVTSGTRPLRFISILGVLSIFVGLGLSAFVLWEKISRQIPVQGWTSLIVVISVFSGAILFALGVLAEYLSLTLTMAMGKPLYLIVSQPQHMGSGRP